jgi:hypothetical protein
MASTAQIFISAPSAEAPLAVLKKTAATGPISFKFESTGAKVLSGKIQESVDGETYTDIAGATVSVAVGGEKVVTVVSSKPYVQIVGSGETSAKVDVTYEGRAFRGTMDLMAIGVPTAHDNL